MSNSSETHSKGISFGFIRKSKQKSIDLNPIRSHFNPNADTIESKTDFVTAIHDKHIESSLKEVKKKELVIPLINCNRYANRLLKTQSIESNVNNNEEKQTDGSLEEMAKRELIREANQLIDGNNKTKTSSSLVIPVIDCLIQNRVPNGFESDEKFDVSLRPVEPSLGDYESVPIEEFGLAMLRGMGWAPGQAIGGKNKVNYTPIEPKIRPKGLGLGAESSLKQEIAKISKNITEEDLEPKKGAKVCIEFGAHKGLYGIIEDFDDDMSRVTVKLSLSKESIKTPVALVRVVSNKEFQSESKIINKIKYEDYKKQEKKESERKQSSHSKDRHEKDRHEKDRHSKHSHYDTKTSDSVKKHKHRSEDHNKDKRNRR